MKYCKTCVNPDTRPNIRFNRDGVCPVCVFGEQRRAGLVDWSERRRELESIVQWGRARSKSGYDCIIPVSGGKDSHRQALVIRDDLGLKPLLVSCVYPPEQLHERGADNVANLISLGFDTITVSLNPQAWKALMRHAFFTYGNWCKSTELALYSIPIHYAIAYSTPLVFLGENPTYTVGETENSLGGDATYMKYCNTLAGGDATKFLIEGISEKDLYFYRYPPDRHLERAEIKIVYLGYYIEDFTSFKNAEVAVNSGMRLREEPPEEMGDFTQSQSLDEEFVVMNQFMKYVKFGFGQVTDKVCEAINLGLMTRDEGMELVKKYDGACHPRYIRMFCDYIDISEDEFWEVVERFRGDMWERGEAGEWALKAKSR